jgi:Putative beta-barrel porin 2
MKKFVASVGLVALGASTMHAADALSAGAQPKLWKISSSLRGFYDDNVNTAPDGAPKDSSLGFTVSPSASFDWSRGQTAVDLSYTYSLQYYDKKPAGNTDRYDQDHTFNGKFIHAFSERYQVTISDSFVVGQEPDVLRANDISTTVQRIPGNNIRNSGSINFDAQMTRLFSVEVGYANSFFDYNASGATLTTNGVGIVKGTNFFAGPSASGTSDRIEQYPHIDLRWLLEPETTGVLGYQFGQVSYTSGEPIGVEGDGTVLYSRDRNNRSHYIYVGADHAFSPDLSGSIRGGGRMTDFYNDPNNQQELTPYALASMSYNYRPGSYLRVGGTYDRNSTDLVNVSQSGFVRDQDSGTIFGSITHEILPNLHAGATAQVQYSTFNGGSLNGKSETYYLAGANLQYQFNQHLSGGVSYNYDKVDSQAGRSYDRNRVYLGFTASY